MRSTLLPVLLHAAIAIAWFGPSVRIDHEDKPDRSCVGPAIALGPGTGSSQPLYVVFEDDSVRGVAGRNIMFQKSTDAGRTWLPADVLVRRCGPSLTAQRPDIATDVYGNLFVVYSDEDSMPNAPICCVRSTDGGATWSPPTRVDDRLSGAHGWIRITADPAGNLFCAWNDERTGISHSWSSVSTDQGATWSQNVRVDDDSTSFACFQTDVFVQPGTNHYLVVAQAPSHCYLYRSTDMGQTFQPGVRLDALGNPSQPHVVADAQHVICNYTQDITEARTLYTQPDTWGAPHLVGFSHDNGAKLAISVDGRVHTALMVYDSIGDSYRTCYTTSSDHGVSWSAPELVNDDTTISSYDPDTGADSAGHAYVVWRANTLQYGEIWFATNNPAAIAEQPPQQPVGVQPLATVVRNVLFLPEATGLRPQAASLMDISGRKVMDLNPGANDVRRWRRACTLCARSHRPQAVSHILSARSS